MSARTCWLAMGVVGFFAMGCTGRETGNSSSGSTGGNNASTSGGSSGNASGSGSGSSASSSSGGSGNASSSSGGASGAAAPATQANGRYLPDNAPWYEDVTDADVTDDSDEITAWMVAESPDNGWGTGDMRIDFSIVAVDVPPGTQRTLPTWETDYHYTPDCDEAPVPLVPRGAVEETYGETTDLSGALTGYNCHSYDDGGDCHMLFVSRSEQRLYEIYHGTVRPGGEFRAGCLAIWDTSTVNANGRGQQCTSADAAGFPIAPLLFTPEEVAAGEIDHAIRFILPNSMIRMRQYVAPATHGTNTTGPATSGPYGFHMRLRADFPLSTLSTGAQVVARALQKYGMYMSDGGNIALTAQSDVLSTVKWADVGLDSRSLDTLSAADFQVIDHGATTAVTYDCQRAMITN